MKSKPETRWFVVNRHGEPLYDYHGSTAQLACGAYNHVYRDAKAFESMQETCGYDVQEFVVTPKRKRGKK